MTHRLAPPDDRVLRRPGDIGVIGQLGHAEIEFGTGLEGGRRGLDHSAFAVDELALGLAGSPAIVEALVLLRLGQVADMLRNDWVVEFELGIFEPVRLGRERNIVQGAELLDLGPADPSHGQAAGDSGGTQLLCGREGIGQVLGALSGSSPPS
jgi:hypothetical protein